MQIQQIRWLVEYNKLGTQEPTREYFASKEAADAFMEDLSSNHIAMMYPVDEEGRPIPDDISNFNT